MFEPAVKEQLRVRAARNGRSMEAELLAILAEAVGTERDREPNLAAAIAAASSRSAVSMIWAAPVGHGRRAACVRPVIVLDTNVISELMPSQPHPAVTAWVAAQSRGSLYTTSVNGSGKLFYGISAMPEGRRRSGLAAGAEALFAEEFAGRVLVFGGAAARRYAEIVILRRQAGKPIEAFDALIAATALVAGAAVATRDIAGFEGCGLTLINPWQTS